MHVSRWSIVIATSDHAEAECISGLLRGAGAADMRAFTDSEEALVHLASEQANVLITSLDAEPVGGLDWVRRLRRQRECRSHKAPIVLIARTLTPAIAEACRSAGANAVVAPPLQDTLLRAIKKVFARPRPFINDADYVGPCRRTAIISVGPRERRRA